MSFENLGVGGTLTFDEKPALAGMRRANHAFHEIEGAAENFRGKMDRLGESMEHFNLIGLGLGSLGIVGIEELGKQAFEAQTQFEDMQVVLSTILGITRHMDIGASVKVAADEMDRLEIAAAKAPGETEDLLGIYKQIVGPLSAMGKSLDEVQNLTVSGAIAAQALGIPFQDMAFSMEKLISGEVRAEDTLFRMLRSQKLITESAAEWKAMTDEKRMLKINVIMAKYGERADQVGNTWTAVSGTIKSIVKIMERAAIAPIFEHVRDSVHKFTDEFMNNMEHYKKIGEQVGQHLYDAFELFVEALKNLINDGMLVYEWLGKVGDRAHKLFQSFGIGGDQLDSIKMHLLEVALALGAILPGFALLRMALGPLAAMLNVVVAGVEYLWTAVTAGLEGIAAGLGVELLPLLLGIAAVAALVSVAFMAMRADGEDFTDTLSRWWTDALEPWWEGFKAAWKQFYPEIIAPLKEAWDQLSLSGRLLFDTLAGDMNDSKGDWKSWGETAGAAIGAVVQSIATMIGWFGQALAFVLYLAANIKYAFDVVTSGIANGFFVAIESVKNVFKGLYNAITAPFRAILNYVADIVDKLDKTMPGHQYLVMNGMGGLAGDLRGITQNGALGKMQYSDSGDTYGDVGPSPQEREYQKQLQRAEDADRAKGMRAAGAMLGYMMSPPSANVTVEDKRCVEVNANMNVDGRQLSAAQARHQIELMDRSGASATPWQRKAAVVRAKEMGGPK